MRNNSYFTLRRIDQLNNYLLAKITDFLQQDDLNIFIQATQNTNVNNRLFKIAKAKLLFKKYINAGDRPYYYSLFQHPLFIEYESYHIASLPFEQQIYAPFQLFPNQVQTTINSSTLLLPEYIRQQLQQKMMTFVTDPGIVMPGLKRETLGLYVNSAFQNFLVLQKDQTSKQFIFLDQIFQNLKQYLNDMDQQITLNIKSAKQTKIKTVLHKPHLITIQNMKDLMLQNNALHNLIVGLFVLLDLRLRVVKEYLQTLKEPFHVTIQLITRYSLYESMITGIQQNFGFIFQKYSDICRDISGQNIELKFWKHALAKWISTMQHFHTKTNLVFNSLASSQIKNELQQSTPCQALMQIPDPPNLIDYKHTIFQIIENDPCDLPILITNYQQYFIDLSVNEKDVHWCGHTKQNLDLTFENFEDSYLEYEKKYYFSLKSLIQKKDQIKELVIQRLQASSKVIKPRIINKLIEWVNLYVFFCKPMCLQTFEDMNQNLERANKNSLNMDINDKIQQDLYISTLLKQKGLNQTKDNTFEDFSEKSLEQTLNSDNFIVEKL